MTTANWRGKEWREAARVWKEEQKVAQGNWYEWKGVEAGDSTVYRSFVECGTPLFPLAVMEHACDHPAWPYMMNVCKVTGWPSNWPWDLMVDAMWLDGEFPKQPVTEMFYWGIRHNGTHIATDKSTLQMINRTFGPEETRWFRWDERGVLAPEFVEIEIPEDGLIRLKKNGIY